MQQFSRGPRTAKITASPEEEAAQVQEALRQANVPVYSVKPMSLVTSQVTSHAWMPRMTGDVTLMSLGSPAQYAFPAHLSPTVFASPMQQSPRVTYGPSPMSLASPGGATGFWDAPPQEDLGGWELKPTPAPVIQSGPYGPPSYPSPPPMSTYGPPPSVQQPLSPRRLMFETSVQTPQPVTRAAFGYNPHLDLSEFGVNRNRTFFFGNIENITEENMMFRKVIYTGDNDQIVVMMLGKGEDIGMEAHENSDQFFRIESGKGYLDIDDGSGRFERVPFKAGDSFLVPVGIPHNVVSDPNFETRLYTIYAPPVHEFDVFDQTKADARLREKDMQLSAEQGQ